MRFPVVLRKCLRDQRRDVPTLLLTVFCASFFVLLYKVMLPDESFHCRVLVLDESAVGSRVAPAELLTRVMEGKIEEGAWKGRSATLDYVPVGSREEGRKLLRNAGADAMLIVTADHLHFLERPRSGSPAR
jgi:ABC-type Na+ efflux pump permease subunit